MIDKIDNHAIELTKQIIELLEVNPRYSISIVIFMLIGIIDTMDTVLMIIHKLFRSLTEFRGGLL